jgi:hypothetical protein
MGMHNFGSEEFVPVREMTEDSQQSLPTENNIENLKMSGLECSTLNFIKDYLVALSEYIKDNF